MKVDLLAIKFCAPILSCGYICLMRHSIVLFGATKSCTDPPGRHNLFGVCLMCSVHIDTCRSRV